MERICIFGGTFNPLHVGHIVAVREACRIQLYDRIFFVPAYFPPHKDCSGITAASHRAAMLEIALSVYDDLQWSDIELRRQGTSYTIDTIRYFHQEYPEAQLFFLTGADSLSHLHKWKDVRALLQECTVTIISRPGFALTFPPQLKTILAEPTTIPLSITAIDLSTPDISSSLIRKRLTHKEDITDLVSPEVADYIQKHSIYQ